MVDGGLFRFSVCSWPQMYMLMTSQMAMTRELDDRKIFLLLISMSQINLSVLGHIDIDFSQRTEHHKSSTLLMDSPSCVRREGAILGIISVIGSNLVVGVKRKLFGLFLLQIL